MAIGGRTCAKSFIWTKANTLERPIGADEDSKNPWFAADFFAFSAGDYADSEPATSEPLGQALTIFLFVTGTKFGFEAGFERTSLVHRQRDL